MKKYLCFVLSIVLIFSVFVFNESIVGAKVVKKKGIYTTATVKNTKNSIYSHPVIKKIVVKKNKITTYGGYWYRKNNKVTAKRIKKAKRTFKIASNCKYVYGAPPAKVQKVSKSFLISHIKRNIKNNVYAEDLELTVRNGKVVRMRVLQG